MSFLRVVVAAVLSLALVLPGVVQAQAAPAFVSAASYGDTLLPLPDQEAQEDGWGRKILASLGGAVVGAGLGYFASQVLVGDWDEEGASPNRALWLGVGGAVGFAVGFTVGPAPRSPPAGGPLWQREPGRAVIGEEEIAESSSRTVYELIDIRRPDWLILRGPSTWAETRGETVSGMAGGRRRWSEETMEESPLRLKVYLDGMLLGGVDELRTLDTGDVVSVHRLTAAQASTRWGAGHANGAILVVTTR